MNQNGGAQAVIRGGRRPWPHRSDGTGYQYKKMIPQWPILGTHGKKQQSHTLNQRAANSNLNPKKVGCFAELEKTVLTPI